MSICVTESPTSRRMLDAQHSEDDAFAREEQGAREEIAQAFSLIGRVPSRQIALPMVKAPHREGSVSLATAVCELTSEGYVNEELLAVIDGSDCPLVQKLREALCARWQKQHQDLCEAGEYLTVEPRKFGFSEQELQEADLAYLRNQKARDAERVRIAHQMDLDAMRRVGAL